MIWVFIGVYVNGHRMRIFLVDALVQFSEVVFGWDGVWFVRGLVGV